MISPFRRRVYASVDSRPRVSFRHRSFGASFKLWLSIVSTIRRRDHVRDSGMPVWQPSRPDPFIQWIIKVFRQECVLNLVFCLTAAGAIHDVKGILRKVLRESVRRSDVSGGERLYSCNTLNIEWKILTLAYFPKSESPQVAISSTLNSPSPIPAAAHPLTCKFGFQANAVIALCSS